MGAEDKSTEAAPHGGAPHWVGSLGGGLGLSVVALVAIEVAWPGVVLGGFRHVENPAVAALLHGLAWWVSLVLAAAASVWVTARVTGDLVPARGVPVVALWCAGGQLLTLPLGLAAEGRFGSLASAGVVVVVGLGTTAYGWSRVAPGRFTALLGRSVVALALVGLASMALPGWQKPYHVPSSSMGPTLVPGDKVQTAQLRDPDHRYRRGEVVAYRPPEIADAVFLGRVIGLPGETLEVSKEGTRIQGELGRDVWGWRDPSVPDHLREATLERAPHAATFASEPIPEGHYFVMGDHRFNSQDSRFFGAVPGERIEGYAYYLYAPWARRRPLDPAHPVAATAPGAPSDPG